MSVSTTIIIATTLPTFLLLQTPGNIGGSLSFTEYGVLGLLGIAVIALLNVVNKLSTATTESIKSQTQVMIDFVNGHRTETTKSMDAMTTNTMNTMREVAGTVSQGYKELSNTITSSHLEHLKAQGEVLRLMDEMLVLNRTIEAARLKKEGANLDLSEIEEVMRRILNERRIGNR